MNHESICLMALQTVRAAGDFIITESKSFNKDTISDKGLNQLVSYVDVETEKILVKGLSAILPQAGFLTEEGTAAIENNQLCWVIDPLDGTTNFVHGLPVYSISVALLQNKIPVVGIVFQVQTNEMFYAWKNGGAWLNNQPIAISKTTDLKNSLLATGFPYYDFEQTNAYLKVLSELMRSSHGLRRMGSAAIDLAYTACGRFEGFFEYGLNAWDVAAGVLLIQEAGGTVCDFSAGNNAIFGKQIVAGNPLITHALQTIIAKEFKT